MQEEEEHRAALQRSAAAATAAANATDEVPAAAHAAPPPPRQEPPPPRERPEHDPAAPDTEPSPEREPDMEPQPKQQAEPQPQQQQLAMLRDLRAKLATVQQRAIADDERMQGLQRRTHALRQEVASAARRAEPLALDERRASAAGATQQQLAQVRADVRARHDEWEQVWSELAVAKAATVVCKPPVVFKKLPKTTQIWVLQENPKNGKSAERYERYKVIAGDGRQGCVA